MSEVPLPPGLRPLVLTAGQVAHLLGMSEKLFARQRDELVRDHGFPAKLPGVNKYSQPAVIRWIETNGQTFAPAAPDAALESEIEDLEKAYGRQQVAA